MLVLLILICFIFVTVKNLVGGRTYYFRVLANSLRSYESSDEVKFSVPARVKHKAITAGVVGGILFFIVAIILSVCAVKICNKRKRRKQEKGYYYLIFIFPLTSRLSWFLIVLIFSYLYKNYLRLFVYS